MRDHLVILLAALSLTVTACRADSTSDLDVGAHDGPDQGARDAASDAPARPDAGECGACTSPPACADESPDPCACACEEGEIFGEQICTATGCLRPLPTDMGRAPGDAGPDATTSVDQGEGGDDGGSEDGGSEDAGDASTDDVGDPFPNRPLGQCASNSDCPEGPLGRDCSEALPGGACLGCGDDLDCPGAAVCTPFGACALECELDDDCPPGLDCKASGRCGAVACQNGACPVPLFGCSDSDLCQRIECADDPSVCPAATTCSNGWCIEDR